MYNNSGSVYKKPKLNHYSYNIWRLAYLIKSNPIHHSTEKRIWNRGSNIPSTFLNYEVTIHAGKKWHTRRITKWSVGFKFGELTWNRKVAIYKAKQLRKKSKKS